MKALVVYESMYGNTHVVANRIAEGMRGRAGVDVVGACDATIEMVAEADILVVGGPTHVHGMSSERSRAAATDAVSIATRRVFWSIMTTTCCPRPRHAPTTGAVC
jgi:flavorubredoxin